jgi:MerR family transcriptional regulator, aldehyde-responsive regulator
MYDPMYSISEVSSKSGVTAHTLRYYEKEGVLPPIERDAGRRRTYSEENLAWLDIVTCLKQTNMPISDIKEIVRLSIIGDTTIADRRRILATYKEKLLLDMIQLEKNIKKNDRKIAFYDGAETC